MIAPASVKISSPKSAKKPVFLCLLPLALSERDNKVEVLLGRRWRIA